jgi:hypothetical protein
MKRPAQAPFPDCEAGPVVFMGQRDARAGSPFMTEELIADKGGLGMPKTMKLKQLRFVVPNRVGLLSEVTTFLANGKINIEALCAYGMGEQGVFMLVTDNNAKAKKMLTQMGAEVLQEEIIAVELPNKPGQLQKVAKKVSEADVDINYVYVSPSGSKMTVVFKTADDKKILKALKK